MAGPTVITSEDIANAQSNQAAGGTDTAADFAAARANSDRIAAPSAALDVVAVKRQSDLTQVFQKARPLNASVNEGGDVMQHPLEDGSQIVDHLVQRLTEISYPVVIGGDYKTTLAEIRQIYKAGTLLIVQTRTGSYENMVLFDIPHEETAEGYDMISCVLKFREARFIKPTLGGPVPRTAKHANATKRGQIQPATPPAPRGSFLFRHIPVH